MSIIYGTENELKTINDKIAAIPEPQPETPFALYKHKVVWTGASDAYGTLYYLSDNSFTTTEAMNPVDWFNAAIKEPIIFNSWLDSNSHLESGVLYGSTSVRITIHKFNGEDVEKILFLTLDNGDNVYKWDILTSITSDELVE